MSPADPAAVAGRWFEDFAVADEVRTPVRTVTAADVAAFAGLTGDHNPLHVDPEFAAAGPYGRPVAHGLLGLAVAVGLVEQTRVHEGTTLAMLELLSWSFRRPLPVGGQVSAVMTVAGTYPSTRDPGRGVLVRHVALLSGTGEVLQEGVMTLLVRRRAPQLCRLDARC